MGMTARPVRFVMKYFAVLSSAVGVVSIARDARGTCNFRRKGGSPSVTERKSAKRFKAGSGRGIGFVPDASDCFFCVWKRMHFIMEKAVDSGKI